MKKIVALALFSIYLLGCGLNLPFNNRLSYFYVREAKKLSISNVGPISIKWVPSEFPKRVDIQGSSGYVGGAPQNRIPTGIAISSRIIEVIDSSIGIDESSNNIVTIKINEAKTEFEYCALSTSSPSIDLGRCFLDIEFITDNKTWRKQFKSEAYDPTYGCTSQTGILEKVWDDIALQVGREIIENL